jgi:hypothetical protein
MNPQPLTRTPRWSAAGRLKLAELATHADALAYLVLSGSASELEADLPFWGPETAPERLSIARSHMSVPEATHLSLATDREHSRACVDAVRATLTGAEAAATRPR